MPPAENYWAGERIGGQKLLCRLGKQIDQIDTGGLLGRVKAHLRLDMSPGGISLSYCTFSTKILLLEYRH